MDIFCLCKHLLSQGMARRQIFLTECRRDGKNGDEYKNEAFFQYGMFIF